MFIENMCYITFFELGGGGLRVHKISSFTADLKENGVKMKE